MADSAKSTGNHIIFVKRKGMYSKIRLPQQVSPFSPSFLCEDNYSFCFAEKTVYVLPASNAYHRTAYSWLIATI